MVENAGQQGAGHLGQQAAAGGHPPRNTPGILSFLRNFSEAAGTGQYDQAIYDALDFESRGLDRSQSPRKWQQFQHCRHAVLQCTRVETVPAPRRPAFILALRSASSDLEKELGLQRDRMTVGGPR